jgi:hypothetical protein
LDAVLNHRTPVATPAATSAMRWLLGCTWVLVAGLGWAQEAPTEVPTPEEIRAGVEASLRAQFEAYNAEDMDKLLKYASQEMPSRQRFVTEVDISWSVNDSYVMLESFEILEDSDTPGAKFEYPYATVRVIQTVLELPINDERVPVFLRKCRKNASDPRGIAKTLGVLRGAVTSSVDVLFQHEGGTWKIVNGLTSPVLAGESLGNESGTGIGVPGFRRIKVSGSVFN